MSFSPVTRRSAEASPTTRSSLLLLLLLLLFSHARQLFKFEFQRWAYCADSIRWANCSRTNQRQRAEHYACQPITAMGALYERKTSQNNMHMILVLEATALTWIPLYTVYALYIHFISADLMNKSLLSFDKNTTMHLFFYIPTSDTMSFYLCCCDLKCLSQMEQFYWHPMKRAVSVEDHKQGSNKDY